MSEQNLHETVQELVKIQGRLDTNDNRLHKISTKVLRTLRLIKTEEIEDQIKQLLAERENAIGKIKTQLTELDETYQEVESFRFGNLQLEAFKENRLVSLLKSQSEDLGYLINTNLFDTNNLSTRKQRVESTLAIVKAHNDNILQADLKRQTSTAMSDILKEVDQVGVNDKYLVCSEIIRLQTLLDGADKIISQINDANFINNVSKSLKNYNDYISSYNVNYIRSRKKQYSELFNSHVHLDEQQQEAIIKDDKFNLVIAGAGSGKTEVLITRIAYLIKSDHIQPERILALAYQNRAAREIEKRLEKYGIIGVNARTFHVLGKDIVEKAIGKKVEGIVTEGHLANYVLEHYITPLKDTQSELYNQFLRFIVTFNEKESRESAYTKYDNYYDKKTSHFTTINNTTVKSWAEKEIMDFFTTHTLNGKIIVAEYEHRVQVENGPITNFRPDFYLPEYDLFIENWAIDEGEEVPEWFNGTTEDYRNHMRYKVQWFEENKKPYVSMYSKEYDRENPEAYINLLKTRLIEKLKVIKNEEYIFTPRSYDEIIEVAWGLYKDPIPQNIINFINIAKTYGFKPNDVDDILSKGDWSLKQRAFGKLALSVYRIYQEELEKSGMIDFGDMINRAIDEMQKNPQLYSGVYDHVLIDEYQDISLQRFRLIEELLRRNPNCKLFCVGDDWQSIMSFAGSDVQFFINFKDYFSSPSVSEISTNYRSIKTIVDAGAQVIQNNRENQISKTTKAKNNVEKRIKIFVLNHQKVYEKNYLKQIAEDCVNRIDDYLKDYSEYAPHDILVLSRFRKHPIVRHFKEYAQEKGIKVASEKQASRDEVRILTVHKSKGLQAKVVFILNVVKGPYGFPCTLQDPSIYEPIRKDSPKQDRLQEERRLFYVALTRAKEDVIIYTWGNARSEFLKEIEGYTEEELLPYWKTRDESPPK